MNLESIQTAVPSLQREVHSGAAFTHSTMLPSACFTLGMVLASWWSAPVFVRCSAWSFIQEIRHPQNPVVPVICLYLRGGFQLCLKGLINGAFLWWLLYHACSPISVKVAICPSTSLELYCRMSSGGSKRLPFYNDGAHCAPWTILRYGTSREHSLDTYRCSSFWTCPINWVCHRWTAPS